jgi:DNA-binding CsgD family transcriptional regulator
VLGFINRARGDLDAARAAYDEAIAMGERGRPVGLALVSLSQGRNEEAAEILSNALHAIPPTQPLVARQILPYAVEALIATGRTVEARDIVEQAPSITDAVAGLAQLLHARGLVKLAEGKPAEAAEDLAGSADAWDKKGNRLEARRARVALIEALLSSGDTTNGLAMGRNLLEDLGRPLQPREREVVRRLLRRAGVRTRAERGSQRAVETGKPTLTSREEAVLREVAIGRTNREIASALGIAEKTVSVHVSHILAKLGCRTRTQAARFVVQQ